MKALFKLVCILVVLGLVAAIGAGVYVYMNKDTLIAKVIEEALEYILQVDVSLASAKLDIQGSRIDLYDLAISNPEGFKQPEAFSFTHATVDIDLASLRTDIPALNLLSMKEPKITLEHAAGGSNFDKLIANAARLESQEETEPMDVKIDKIIVENATVTVSAPILPKAITLKLARLELNNIGTEDGTISASKAIKILLSAILKESLKSGKGILPDNLMDSFKGGAEVLKERLDMRREMLEESLGTGGENLKETTTEATEKVKTGLKGLFNKK